MRYKGIIFDLDGVLCFTDQYHYLAWKEVADEIGVYFDENINNRLRGVSRMESISIILERADREYSIEEKKALAEKKNSRYVELLQQMDSSDLPDEVRETLEKLHFKDYKLAVGSSSKNAKLILERLGLSSFFDAVSDGTNIIHSKPNPEVFLKAAKYLKLEPHECLVVEDALAGIDAAKAGGMSAVGIGEASRYEKADFKIRSFADLLTLV